MNQLTENIKSLPQCPSCGSDKKSERRNKMKFTLMCKCQHFWHGPPEFDFNMSCLDRWFTELKKHT